MKNIIRFRIKIKINLVLHVKYYQSVVAVVVRFPMENEGERILCENSDENRKLQLVKNRFLNLASTQ